ncbi:MAG: hypothetical protein WC394_04660 [Candidatus Omnitrophota bacterium]|jgi:hypothetical protein
MNLIKSFLCGAMVLSIGIALTLAQEGGGAEAINQELKDSDMQWVLGEVANVDLKDKVINIKYLDFEDSQMKDMLLNIDSGTAYEGVKSIDEIKPMDSLSIDYVITQDGKNLAKNIGLDTPKEPQVTEGLQVENQAEGVGQVEAEKQTLETVQ